MTPKTLGPRKIWAFDFIEFFLDQKQGLGPGLVRVLVRLVQAGPNWTKELKAYEIKGKKLDQDWTKTGPVTVLVRSPRFLRKARAGVEVDQNVETSEANHDA